MQTISKSQFKPQVLEYLRLVEKTKVPIIITHAGKPVVKVVAYTDKSNSSITSLRKSVLSYKNPFQPVADTDWEALS